MFVYGALIAFVALVAMANGGRLVMPRRGVWSCVQLVQRRYPFPMIVSIAVSVIAGALMARRRTRT